MKRYDLSREYRGNIGAPEITEQPEGAYVLHDDYAAVFDELRAENAGLEAIVAGQAGEIADAKGQIEHLDRQNNMLREALSGIRQYGNDTLSGRADGGPDDRKRQRDAVIEMRNRARAALSGESNG